ncbi:phosphotransferase [Arenibacter sp. F20364]|uniref:phosphotransferase n=1 Tax=Arenibacter sp. F20364 TaxID=2926415 RepID=UPI001FF4F3BE|nr:phosphotransferase [Arenibacter sp. F20364]MCK0192730.1 phosphotransferase [Arenibacter sp. F20364]
MEKLTRDIDKLGGYLKRQGWLFANENITAVEVPGEGNMNFTLRIKTTERSFVIKQSRDYVEKFPQVAAPVERAIRESEFYSLISDHNILKWQMPKLNGVDRYNHVLNFQDLGNGVDCTYLYQKDEYLEETDLQKIMVFASTLHKSINTDVTNVRLPNRKMRKLNHEHIFIYPYIWKNGLNLDDILPGLKEIGDNLKSDDVLKYRVQKLGEMYLADGKTLLHGDYFPGSWFKTPDDIKIIDPEFCFFGRPEFEIGVTVAHLKMSSQPITLIDKALKIYMDSAPLDKDLCFQFMAIEILRRLLGLAQLPLSLDLEERKALLEEARSILV